MLYSKIAMKKIYLYISLVLVLSVNLYSCKEDETPVYPTENDELVDVSEDKTEMTVSTEKIDVIKDQSKVLEIQSGAGDYKASVLDKSIAEVSVEGNSILVIGKNYGNTELVVSDKNGNYKNVKVEVYKTDELKLANNSIELVLPFGKPSESSVMIVSGNGGYTIISSNKSVATVEIDPKNPENIIIKAFSVGETELSVTDYRGLNAKVMITVISKDTPFSDQQLESIKADNEVKYMFGITNYLDIIKGENNTRWESYYNGKSKNFSLDYGVTNYYACGAMYTQAQKHILVVQFDNEISYEPGSKYNGKLYVKNNRQFILNNVDCTFEVIQYKDGKVWATYYHVDEESGDVSSGYMIFNE